MLCIFVGYCVRSTISLLGERLCVFVRRASDWIYENRVFDPRSTQLAPHNSTSNRVGGKEAISVNSSYLNILVAFKLS